MLFVSLSRRRRLSPEEFVQILAEQQRHLTELHGSTSGENGKAGLVQLSRKQWRCDWPRLSANFCREERAYLLHALFAPGVAALFLLVRAREEIVSDCGRWLVSSLRTADQQRNLVVKSIDAVFSQILQQGARQIRQQQVSDLPYSVQGLDGRRSVLGQGPLKNRYTKLGQGGG